MTEDQKEYFSKGYELGRTKGFESGVSVAMELIKLGAEIGAVCAEGRKLADIGKDGEHAES